MDYYYYDDYDTAAANDIHKDDYVFDHDYESRFFSDESSLQEVFYTCFMPSLGQTLNYVIALLGFSLLCRIIWLLLHRLLPKRLWLLHVTSMACGFGALYFMVGYHFFVVLLFSLVAYALMILIERFKINGMGIIIAVITIATHFIYELLWEQPETWQKIRGIQMVATMKIISFAFDIEFNEIKEKQKLSPLLVPYLGYIFYPATSVLGPWISFNTYQQSVYTMHFEINWIFWSLTNAKFALIFLCLSNCMVPMICSDRSWKLLRAYRDALSVRCSHYFICFLSQAILNANGGVTNMKTKPNQFFGYMITKPWTIEFPRSLSSLVRCWNIPMHDWLKNYVFRAVTNRSSDYLIAILSTYLISSLLHGFHVKIYMVLLSLGCFAYVETVLRAKLANVFDACITANSCTSHVVCRYKYCTTKAQNSNKIGAILVRLVNFGFSLLCIIHLAYLGIMMNDTVGNEHNRFSITNELWKWSDLNYSSHWIAAFTYLCYLII